MRALVVVLALALGLGAYAMVATMLNVSDMPRCDDLAGIGAYHRAHPADRTIQCFSGRQGKKVIVMALGFAGGAVGAIAAILALAFTVTGLNDRRVLWATALALILSGLSFLVGSI